MVSRLLCGAVAAVVALGPAAAKSANLGRWGATIQFPSIPVSAAVLPDGNLLTWASNQPWFFEGDIGQQASQTYTSVYNPATGGFEATVQTSMMADMFCSGIAYLTDGRILVNGGSSSQHTALYDPATDSWTSDASMNISRGYNSTVTLSDGRAFTIGGSWSGDGVPKDGEIWAKNVGWATTAVPDSAILADDPIDDQQGYISVGDNHPWLFAAPNGRIFHAGPGPQMNWIDTSAQGTAMSAGNRADDAYSQNGVAVMWAPGQILKAGGAPSYTDAYATTSAYVIDVTAGFANPNVNTAIVRKAGSMAYPRAYANGVVLPGGGVLVIGGQGYAHQFYDDNSILTPELWSPVTGTFTPLAPMATPRNYHSVALLMPDGRVFSGGGGLCGEGCPANHSDGAFFSPPYLFQADGSTPAPRPVLVRAPASARLGDLLTVSTNGPVAAFELIRLSATTHTVNTDQRRVPLSFWPGGSTNTYDLSIPWEPGIVVPGYWMLFALDASGVPSVAKIIFINFWSP
ncbi:MAG TPA: galactose oxidase-like domain-containing protein [Acetobacteraceae bacterium]|nr:galactose oxidase-like domain-containing protein [Acetobacteraceae bacterium]